MLAWWAGVTLGPDLGVEDATTDEIHAAMDWLEGRQDAIEARLARRHLATAANPQRMALFDLSSSWLEGSRCPLGARGYSRDGNKAKVQIEYGLLTDPGAARSRSASWRGTPPTPQPSPRSSTRSTANSG